MNKEYKVSFWKREFKEDKATKKLVATGAVDFLGSVTIDDTVCVDGSTLTAKAFRICPPACLLADKTTMQQI